MSYYKKRTDFHTIENMSADFLVFLRRNCRVLKETMTPPMYRIKEAFILEDNEIAYVDEHFRNFRITMQLGGFLKVAPLDDKWSKLLLYIVDEPDAFTPTVSPTHIRLPKLSHLITLTPEDFFSIFKILASGRPTATGTSMILDAATSFAPIIQPFFVTNDASWRTNPDYTDTKWTTRDDIAFVAALQPTAENQLYAMQYLTARQNADLFYFPAESSVQLELDWQSIDDNYVVPEAAMPL